MLQTTFEFVDKSIQIAIIIPEQGAKVMKLALKLLEKKIYPSVSDLIDVAEDGLVAYCDIVNKVKKSLDTNDGDDSWCRILFNCRAFIELIFDEHMRATLTAMTPTLTSAQRQSMTKDYASFANYLCKMSLSSIVSAFINSELAKVYQQIEFIIQKMQGIQGCDYVLGVYDEVLQGAYVYDVLAEYDKFAKCAFTICDLDKDSYKARKAVLDRLYLTGSNGSYSIDRSVDFIASAYDVEGKINARVNHIKTAMQMGETDPFASCDYIAKTIKPSVEKRKVITF